MASVYKNPSYKIGVFYVDPSRNFWYMTLWQLDDIKIGRQMARDLSRVRGVDVVKWEMTRGYKTKYPPTELYQNGKKLTKAQEKKRYGR